MAKLRPAAVLVALAAIAACQHQGVAAACAPGDQKLVGHYYLDGIMEVGSELLLKSDGSFEFALAYGALDQYGKGCWTVSGRSMPRYPVLPATLVGRLAVDSRYQGRQVGQALVVDALQRSIQAAPASFALLVDAKDDGAAAFYRRLGFIPLVSRPLSLFLPMATALKLFA